MSTTLSCPETQLIFTYREPIFHCCLLTTEYLTALQMQAMTSPKQTEFYKFHKLLQLSQHGGRKNVICHLGIIWHLVATLAVCCKAAVVQEIQLFL